MHLFEVTNGFVGCSYKRCYIWANSVTEAIELIPAKMERPVQLKEMLNTDLTCPFVTEICDEGFEHDAGVEWWDCTTSEMKREGISAEILTKWPIQKVT